MSNEANELDSMEFLCTPPALRAVAEIVNDQLLPKKLKDRYKQTHAMFKKWLE